MAFSLEPNRGTTCEINITPLIDVLLVLLIIFMVIVPVASRGLAVATPSQSAAYLQQGKPERPVLVQITAVRMMGGPDGAVRASYQVDGQDVPLDSFESQIEMLLRPRAERLLLVQADPGLAYGVVAEAIDRGRSAGAEQVELLTPRSNYTQSVQAEAAVAGKL